MNASSGSCAMSDQISTIGLWAQQLTDAERHKISQVLQRDLALQEQEQHRINDVRAEVQRIRSQTALRSQRESPRQCVRCQAKLGLLLSPGEQCPKCKHMICADCQRTYISRQQRKWLCVLCYTTREYKAKSGSWFCDNPDESSQSASNLSTPSGAILLQIQNANKFAKSEPSISKNSAHRTWRKAGNLVGAVRRISPRPSSSSQQSESLSALTVPSVVTRPPSVPDVQNRRPSSIVETSDLLRPPATSLVRANSTGQLSAGKKQSNPKHSLNTLKPISDGDRSVSVPMLQQERDSSNTSDRSTASSRTGLSLRSSLLSLSTIDSTVVQVQGQVLIRLNYNCKMGALEVHVAQCSDLIQIGKSKPNAYVKTYLLPDRSQASKRKSRTKRNSSNPKFNEILRYVGLTKSELEARVLLLSVWHNDYFGRNTFLGEVRLPLGEYPWSNQSNDHYWFSLAAPHEDPPHDPMQDAVTHGRLNLSVKFTPPDLTEQQMSGSLHCLLQSGAGLCCGSIERPDALFVKAKLFLESGKVQKLKSAAARPERAVWNHTFVFVGQTMAELANRRLELTVWQQKGRSSKQFVGRILLATENACTCECGQPTDQEKEVWKHVICSPNTWIDASLPVRYFEVK